MTGPDAELAVRAMGARGIDNPRDLLEFVPAPSWAVAACEWWDKRKAANPNIGKGLLAKKIRDGGVDPDGDGFADAKQRRRLQLARFHEMVERFPHRSVAESHARLQERTEDMWERCDGDLIVVDNRGAALETRCDTCGAEFGYTLRALSDLPVVPAELDRSEPARRFAPPLAGAPRSFDVRGHVSKRWLGEEEEDF